MTIAKTCIVIGVAAMLAGCATDPYTGEQHITKPATGALIVDTTGMPVVDVVQKVLAVAQGG